MHSPSLPYPGHQDLTSQPLPNGGFRIAYHDIDPRLVHYVNNISISKGHRLVSGFFGAGLLMAGAIDWVFGPEVKSASCYQREFAFLQWFGEGGDRGIPEDLELKVRRVSFYQGRCDL